MGRARCAGWRAEVKRRRRGGVPRGVVAARSALGQVRRRRMAGGVRARCVATVGLGNALRAGDPPGAAPAPGRSTCCARCPRRSPRRAGGGPDAGDRGAHAAVLEAGIASVRSGFPATGTGTDCTVVAAPEVGHGARLLRRQAHGARARHRRRRARRRRARRRSGGDARRPRAPRVRAAAALRAVPRLPRARRCRAAAPAPRAARARARLRLLRPPGIRARGGAPCAGARAPARGRGARAVAADEKRGRSSTGSACCVRSCAARVRALVPQGVTNPRTPRLLRPAGPVTSARSDSSSRGSPGFRRAENRV